MIARAIGLVELAVVLGFFSVSCALPEEWPNPNDELPVLTWVDLHQYGSASPIPDSSDPDLRRVAVDIRLVFSAPDHAAVLELLVTHIESEKQTTNQIHLAEVAPDLVAGSSGMGTFRSLVTIPRLGQLRFEAVLVDSLGARSGPLFGHLTVSDSLGATQVN
ncbi:MAG: hypothetical protein ABIR88_02370 [Nitrospiria bacterium]